jgi:NAD/NADP transhydrogenase beta subunit
MVRLAYLFAAFVFAAVLDWLSCEWHAARERNSVAAGAGLAGVIELLGWLPLWYAIQLGDFWIMIASVFGSVAGTAIGLRRRRRVANSLPLAKVIPLRRDCVGQNQLPEGSSYR